MNLLFGGRQKQAGTSVKLIKASIENTIRTWGVWRTRLLSDIADQIIQADVYIAEKLPSFWVLHARSGVQLLLGYTPYTSALWTETARKEVERLLKDPYGDFIPPRRRRRTRRYKRKNKPRARINFVSAFDIMNNTPDLSKVLTYSASSRWSNSVNRSFV